MNKELNIICQIKKNYYKKMITKNKVMMNDEGWWKPYIRALLGIWDGTRHRQTEKEIGV